jgi:uncharacterized protein YbbC (DUF1343 family)
LYNEIFNEENVRIPIIAAMIILLNLPSSGEVRSWPVLNGIDVLRESNFARLSGKRVGLITNHTGLAADGISTIDLLYKAQNLKLAALFSPEHGIRGIMDERVDSSIDGSTGLPVYSLYGDAKRPTPEMLKNIDALVFDIQDVGTRFYTYITTMAYCMEAAAKAKIPFFVLDRPNPIGGEQVEGPVLDADKSSFIGYMPIPVRHGMTVGELAQYFNKEKNIGVQLEVIAMKGWRRSWYFWETGQLWTNPSPNMRTMMAAILYPGVCLLERTNVSVGRGTDRPFEQIGAPWIHPKRLAESLKKLGIRGVEFVPVYFTPNAGLHKGVKCGGISFVVTEYRQLHSVFLGMSIISVLRAQYSSEFEIDKVIELLGNAQIMHRLKNGELPTDENLRRSADFLHFLDKRRSALIYDLKFKRIEGRN